MTLMTRIARLFRADLHAVLDRIEEPDALLRQALREMEDDLGRDEQRLRSLRSEQAQLAAREDESRRTLAALEEELDLCFVAGKPDLARALIRRKLELERTAKIMAKKREALEAGRVDLTSRIEENRERLDQIRQKAEVLAEGILDRPTEAHRTCPDSVIRDEDVEVAFLREQRKRSQP
jgi:phage shock protein A